MIRLRLPAILLICMLLIHSAGSAQIYVAPNGNDANPGTLQLPKATLSSAIRTVREWRRLQDPKLSDGVRIIMRGGLYPLSEPVLIRPEDAGTEKIPTIIQAAEHEFPILSGGVQIRQWKKLKGTVHGLPNEALDHVWVADLTTTGIPNFNFRQLWVNQIKAQRAKDTDSTHMNRILAWNKKTQECWIPKPKTSDLSGVVGMEMLIHQWWEIAMLRIKKYEVRGDSVKLSFMQPESRIQSEHPWPAPWISKTTGNSAFWLLNAIQFLNAPGEWYLDRDAQKLYYWPRKGEQMETAQVIAPYLETLVRVQGNIDHPVSNIHFKGIAFQHTGWLRPSEQGHVPHQVGMYMTDAYSLKIPGTADKKTLENQAWIGRPAAAVSVNFANHNSFENCSFEHLAFNGLDLHEGTNHNLINGNLLKDIGGNAIIAGVYSDEVTEIHLPYQPKDLRVVCSDETISNNLITDATNEDWGCAGIAAGYVRSIKILHNEINEVGYTGISMGWGWSPTANVMQNNTIAYNKIHHYAKHMYDVSGIYTLSAQPRSLITENEIDQIYKAEYVHDPNHWFYLYTDEGSSGITVKNNWTPSDKYLRNANGPNNVWENNGPQVSAQIRSAAGLEPSYRGLLKQCKTADAFRSINHAYKPTVIELVLPAEDPKMEQQLRTLCQQNGLAQPDIYQWKNHLTLYAFLEDPTALMESIQASFSKALIKMYRNPLYDFNRRYNCPDAPIAKDWDHILLTANLVADTLMQQEYIHYHEKQFSQWPEVSKGFCNADFQQLQVFKNGRQLMLVISIPKGESLDHLNPRTTENNPRMNEWNNIMKKYQEGIAGTAPGETWVFLQSLK